MVDRSDRDPPNLNVPPSHRALRRNEAWISEDAIAYRHWHNMILRISGAEYARSNLRYWLAFLCGGLCSFAAMSKAARL
jgi:hypothetical protein